jgi:hypothetical protein
MSDQLIGKFKVNRQTLKDGKEVLVIAGVFHASPELLEQVGKGDEMWVSKIQLIEDRLVYTNPYQECSPEDFISGTNQSPADWRENNRVTAKSY